MREGGRAREAFNAWEMAEQMYATQARRNGRGGGQIITTALK